MSKRTNILDSVNTVDHATLELVRLGENQTAVIPFTTDCETEEVHYCNAPEIHNYFWCPGAGCVGCQAGLKKELRHLFPVYLPASGSVGVLAMSHSLRPLALLPQLINVLKAEKRMVMFISRENKIFTVSTQELGPDAESGEAAIQRFKEADEANQVDLTSVYPRLENDQLADVPELARMLSLKRIPRKS